MPEISKPLLGILGRIDGLLRGQSIIIVGEQSTPEIWHWIAILFAAGGGYGAVMGTFAGVARPHILQIFYSSIKTPILLLATFGLSLPSFFVVNTLLGLRADFRRSLRALISAQAALTVILASLAPFTALWYLSDGDYEAAILFNAAMFAIASGAAQLVLRRSYRQLIARNPLHRWMLWSWLGIYIFVGIQMGWVLRPFIGKPLLPSSFLRADAWSNAYLEVARIIWNKLR